MKYVDGKLRIVVSPYDYIFLNYTYYNNYMFNFGIENKAGTDAKTIDITSVAGDSDNSSKPKETTTAATSTTPENESTTAPQTTAAPETTTAKPAPEPTGTATNVTLRMTGNAADLDRSMLYYYKVDKAFLTNDEVITIKQSKYQKYLFNT